MTFINTRYRMLNYSSKTKRNGLVRRLVTGLPPRRPGFDPRSGNVWFLVDKVAMGQIFSEYLALSCQLSCHPVFHAYLSSGLWQCGPTSGWRTKWTQSHPPPSPNTNWKKPKYGGEFVAHFLRPARTQVSSARRCLGSLHWKCVEVCILRFLIDMPWNGCIV